MRAELEAIPAAEVRRPDIPAHIYFQEALDALVWLEPAEVSAKLTAVGLPAERLGEARQRLEAAREAQARWAAVRSPRKPEEQRALEDEGLALRASVVAAIRWNLRDARLVMGALDRIVEGVGVADLVQDLVDLGELVQQQLAGFASDQTFDAEGAVTQLRQLSDAIRAGLAEYRTDEAMASALALRDRAWTALDDAMTDIRDAGRYAFRNTADARRFASAYERNQRLNQKRRARQAPPADAPAPTT
ncbi:MAG: hypothetical protein CVU56_00660 [Deltaproteobacteria bacterium HGW-Deltaproteobacteria-14]|nr:MAG: hypothetical protein CVU56_00660 [Deltaproteobacteria bacterium HGW-Deltaproteobacteria-14]